MQKILITKSDNINCMCLVDYISMPSLSIVIPAFNEEPRLGRTLESILQATTEQKLSDIQIDRIIVSDDGSTDRTSEVAESWNDRLPMEVVRLPKNKGKGAATREGMKKD